MTKSFRFHLRLILAFIDKFKLILLLSVAIGISTFFVITNVLPNFEKGTEKIGSIGEHTVNTLPVQIAKLISLGLTNIDTAGHPIPGIAESWEAKDDGKTWTFRLNPKMKWQDGTPVTASDINYNFSDAIVTKPDKYTLIFKLKTPLSNFPIVLSKPAFKSGLLGVGEWRVKSLTLAGTYIETLTLQKKNGDEKLFKFYPNGERAKLAYQLGEIDSLEDLMSPEPFDKWTLAKVNQSINKGQYVAVFFNTKDEVLVDKYTRQALTYAIDKASLSKDRALGPISPNSWAYNPSVKPYDFDIKHAKELIKDSNLSPENKKDLKIKLTTVPDLLPIAEKIVKNWKEAGVNASLQVAAYIPSDYQAFLGIYDIPIDPDQYSIWHSSQSEGNITKFKNTRIDKLLEDGRIETSESRRKAVYFDFQKYLLEEAPAAFLYHPIYYNIERS